MDHGVSGCIHNSQNTKLKVFGRMNILCTEVGRLLWNVEVSVENAHTAALLNNFSFRLTTILQNSPSFRSTKSAMKTFDVGFWPG